MDFTLDLTFNIEDFGFFVFDSFTVTSVSSGCDFRFPFPDADEDEDFEKDDVEDTDDEETTEYEAEEHVEADDEAKHNATTWTVGRGIPFRV